MVNAVMHMKIQWPHLCEFREFWYLFQMFWFFCHKSQRNFLLQRNSYMDLHIWAALTLFRQALGTNDNMVSGITRGRGTTDMILWWCTPTCCSSWAAKASCSSICLRLSLVRESYILVLQWQKIHVFHYSHLKSLNIKSSVIEYIGSVLTVLSSIAQLGNMAHCNDRNMYIQIKQLSWLKVHQY